MGWRDPVQALSEKGDGTSQITGPVPFLRQSLVGPRGAQHQHRLIIRQRLSPLLGGYFTQQSLAQVLGAAGAVLVVVVGHAAGAEGTASWGRRLDNAIR